jgi:hypothetical protein
VGRGRGTEVAAERARDRLGGDLDGVEIVFIRHVFLLDLQVLIDTGDGGFVSCSCVGEVADGIVDRGGFGGRLGRWGHLGQVEGFSSLNKVT